MMKCPYAGRFFVEEGFDSVGAGEDVAARRGVQQLCHHGRRPQRGQPGARPIMDELAYQP